MTRALILGIDGLDSQLLLGFKDYLHSFKKIIEHSPKIDFKSVFPPDSSTAWASIYTGLNPAKHGIVFFKDPFDSIAEDHQRKNLTSIINFINERAFWKIAEKAGKKVCALYPYLPILPSFPQTYPPELAEKYRGIFIEYEPLPLYSSYNLKKVIDLVKKRTINQAKIGLEIYNDFEWDVFFMYFPDLDNIEHIFWMYKDLTSLKNPYKDVIFDIYEFFDREVVGKFLDIVKQDVIFIIVSDHGHTRRPTKIVNINEILRRVGFLNLKSERCAYIRSSIKKMIIRLMNEFRIARLLAQMAWRSLPKGLKDKYSSSQEIDYEESIAVLSEPGRVEGLKTYNYAGVRIKEDLLKRDHELYEMIREKIIDILSRIKDPETSLKIVEWICKREELYAGDYISKYPDVIFKLRDEWGVGSDVRSSIFATSYSYKIYSGMHNLATPTLLISLPNDQKDRYVFKRTKACLIDFAPTVLETLRVGAKGGFDGNSILEVKE
ncbi:MAG: alkaline phosphatase family protein [Candidatus Methanoglobus sp.]